MKKNKSTALLLMVLVFVVINVIFFLWLKPAQCGSAEWVSYGFMAFSFLFAVAAMLTYKGKSDETYSLTTVYLPLQYFFVQTVLSVAGIIGAVLIRNANRVADNVSEQVSNAASAVTDSEVALGQAAENVPFLVQHYTTLLVTVYIIIALIYVVRYIVHLSANDATEASLAQQHEEHSYVRDLGGMLSGLLPMVSDDGAKKAVNRLYETVRFSANKTSEVGQRNRQEVAAGITTLTQLIASKDWQAVTELANQLNLKAKMQ